MPVEDCWEGDQWVAEVSNGDVSMNHMLDLWKLDVMDADNVSRRSQETMKMAEKGLG